MPENPYEPPKVVPQAMQLSGSYRTVLFVTAALLTLLAVLPPTRRAGNWNQCDCSYAYSLDRRLFGYLPRYQWVENVGRHESTNYNLTFSIAPHLACTCREYRWVIDWHWVSVQTAIAAAVFCIGLWGFPKLIALKEAESFLKSVSAPREQGCAGGRWEGEHLDYLRRQL